MTLKQFCQDLYKVSHGWLCKLELKPKHDVCHVLLPDTDQIKYLWRDQKMGSYPAWQL